jgi:hypothetical protein
MSNVHIPGAVDARLHPPAQRGTPGAGRRTKTITDLARLELWQHAHLTVCLIDDGLEDQFELRREISWPFKPTKSTLLPIEFHATGKLVEVLQAGIEVGNAYLGSTATPIQTSPRRGTPPFGWRNQSTTHLARLDLEQHAYLSVRLIDDGTNLDFELRREEARPGRPTKSVLIPVKFDTAKALVEVLKKGIKLWETNRRGYAQ